ncbi:hypothetical protein THAOC_34446 [Thalassiosira oceanica]|uniref:Leucine-rich repeat domain-containing protein n=1 Tax=Thalassiosira oceanica TaxID=159749 RepID=K0R4X0_THAOC|nr:hypothetical protein THAOC_34446 [Thalassiosira oceanica]|eukprot:EJK46869.1 hypothetical protein THAOC_34446 [Thalassiosira oceanica]
MSVPTQKNAKTAEPEGFLFYGEREAAKDSSTDFAERLFQSLMFGPRSKVTRVRVGPHVEGIPSTAFHAFNKLAEVQLNEELQFIGKWAFEGTALRSITLPSTVIELDWSAFSGCSNLSEVKLNEGLEYIGNHAFSKCSALRSVTIPSTVIGLGYGAFSSCSSLTEVIFLGGQSVLNHEFLARRLSSEEGILKQFYESVLRDDGSAFRGCPLTRVKISISWAVSERIARLPPECRLSIKERVRNQPRLELMQDENVVAHFPLVSRESESREGAKMYIKDTDNKTAASVYWILQLIAFHELKESSILIELAMWKSRIDGDRIDCRVTIPGPAKTAIMEYCGFAGFLGPAIEGA